MKQDLVYQIKIQLKNIRPSIYRTLLVKPDTFFFRFHEYIQEIFGLENYHLWQFDVGENFRDSRTIALSIPKEEMMFFDDQPEFDAQKTKLSDFLKNEKDKVGYWYDFGDDWRFDVLLQKVFPANELNPKITKIPFLLKAKGPMLFEDIGGIYMMQGVLELYEYLKQGKKLSKKEKKEWEEVFLAILGEDRWEGGDDNGMEEDFLEIIDDAMSTDWKNFDIEK